MNLEDRSYLAYQAMDNISDMDVSLEKYAEAAAVGLGWRDLSNEVPWYGDAVVATDGEARWLDMRTPHHDLGWQGRKATHWHSIADLPVIPVVAGAPPTERT